MVCRSRVLGEGRPDTRERRKSSLLTNTIHLTLKMTSAQVVETSVTNNSSSLNYTHPDDHTIRTTNIMKLERIQRGATKLIGLITVSDVILTGRQSGQKLQCLYGNPMAKNFFQNRILHKL